VQGAEDEVPGRRRLDGKEDRVESRISPTRMMSGSSRRAPRRAAAKDRVSRPTSRWLITQFWLAWANSTGSSMVIMLSFRILLA